MTDLIKLPEPTAGLVGLDGKRPTDVWYRILKRLVDQFNASLAVLTSLGDGTLPTFGTAALKNTGTSGDAVPVLNDRGDYSRQQRFVRATLADATAWDLDEAQSAFLSLTANSTLANPTNMRDGGTYQLIVEPNTYTLAFASAYKWPGGVAPVLSTAAGAIDLLTFVTDGTNMYGVIQKAFA